MRTLQIVLGFFIFVLFNNITPFEGLNRQDMIVLGVLLWMAVWWMTEAVPLAITALIPMAIIPVFTSISTKVLSTGYAHSLIFLVLGASIFGAVFEKTGLSSRIALGLIDKIGYAKKRIILSLSLTVAFISMWMSNTSTVVTMLPIVLTIIYQFQKFATTNDDKKNVQNFAKCALLMLAYSASVGGMGTLIGTPPNAVLASQAKVLGDIQIDFIDWLIVGVPVAVISLLILNIAMTRYIFKLDDSQAPTKVKQFIRDEIAKQGTISRDEKIVLYTFLTVVFFWIFRTSDWLRDVLPWAKNLKDTHIIMMGVISLFLWKNKDSTPYITWEDVMKKIPWGVLLLIGGGVALAGALRQTHVVEWFGTYIESIGILPTVLILVCIALITTFLTEVNSNTATTIILVPVIWSIGQKIGVDSALLTTVLTLSASSAFMLPTATFPNAIVCRDEYVTIRDMIRSGLWLNVIIPPCIAIIVWVIFTAGFSFA